MAARKSSQKPGKRRENGGARESGRPPPNRKRATERRPPDGQTNWIYGLHAVSAALANPKRRCQRLLAVAQNAEFLATLPKRLETEIVARTELEALLPAGAVHQGIALQAPPLPSVSVHDVAADAAGTAKSLLLVLDQVTDPQNVGAALRSAAAFGADAVILPDRNSPPASGALAKAASGAVETVPLVRVSNLVRALEELKTAGYWIAGLDMDAPVTLSGAGLPEKCVFALGAEGQGLRRLTRETCDLMVRVPMTDRIESLNVSASAAVALYEWTRQHRNRD